MIASLIPMNAHQTQDIMLLNTYTHIEAPTNGERRCIRQYAYGYYFGSTLDFLIVLCALNRASVRSVCMRMCK